jgi:hypothetical protein
MVSRNIILTAVYLTGPQQTKAAASAIYATGHHTIQFKQEVKIKECRCVCPPAKIKLHQFIYKIYQEKRFLPKQVA